MADVELVIKISEKVYNALTHTEFDANLVTDEMRKSIANGTPLPDGAEILTIDKRTLKAVTGRFVIYDREWLKEHFNTTEAYLYGGTRTADVLGTNAGDLISRQAAQKLICEDGTRLKQDGVYELTICVVKQWAVDLLDELPSIEPERKTGKWIKIDDDGGYCSECNCDMPIFMEDWKYKSCETDFCPNCGARMEVQNE